LSAGEDGELTPGELELSRVLHRVWRELLGAAGGPLGSGKKSGQGLPVPEGRAGGWKEKSHEELRELLGRHYGRHGFSICAGTSGRAVLGVEAKLIGLERGKIRSKRHDEALARAAVAGALN